MEIFQLKEFTMLARTLSFSETAFRLDVSTSALSRHIQQLEDELDCKLFTRATRSVSLTEAGKVFLPHAVMILQDYEAGMDSLKKHLNREDNRLTLGVYYGFEEYEINKYIAGFRNLYSEYEINLVIGSNGELDTGFRKKLFNVYTASNNSEIEDLNLLKVDYTSIKAVVPVNSHFAESEKLLIKDLAGTPLLLPKENTVFFRSILNCFREENISPIILYTGRFEEVTDFIKNGIGIGLFPFRLNREQKKEGLAFIDINPEMKLEYGFGYRDNLTKPESVFIEHVMKMIEKSAH